MFAIFAVGENKNKNPRVIIVEVHPWLFDEPTEYVTEELERRGYEIIYRSDLNGIEVNKEEFNELLYLSANYKKPGYEHLPSEILKRADETLNTERNLKWPVVVAAVKIH